LNAIKEIEKVKRIAEKDLNIKKLYDYIIGNKDLSFDPDIEKKLKRTIYNPPTFKKLSENETKIARDIIDLIYETVEFKTAELLKKKIVDKYN
jgi:aspartate/methionine/tyrosine aminotransferase